MLGSASKFGQQRGWVGGKSRNPLVQLFDILAATAAWPVALALRHDLDYAALRGDLLLRDAVIVLLLATLVFELGGVHRAFWRFATAADLAAVALGAVLLALSVTMVLFLVDRLATVPRSVPLLFALLVLVFLGGARVGWMLLTRPDVAAAVVPGPAAAARPVLLVGAGEGAALAIQLLRHAAGPTYRAVAILDEEATLGRMIMGVPVLGRLADFGSTLARLQVQGLRPVRVLVTAQATAFPPEALRRLRERAHSERLAVDFLPDLIAFRWPAELPGTAPPVEIQPPSQLAYALAKRSFDSCVAAAVLVLGAPLFLLVALAVGLGLGRPVLFAQLRLGRALVPFTLWKFRTLKDVVDRQGRLRSEAERRSWIGGVLRRTRLDELPQFWNVLRGDMALVGPRPLIAAQLSALPDGGWERSRVRPGLTGWAQVHGGQALGPSEKHALDLWYIRNASFLLDLWILLLTVRTVVLGERIGHAAIRRALADLERERARAGEVMA